MAGFARSGDIFVFPINKTRTANTSGKLLYEQNMAKLLQSTNDVDGSYVISCGEITKLTANEVKFSALNLVLCGYIVNINEVACSASSGNQISTNVYLKFDQNNELVGQDVLQEGTQEYAYDGIYFGTSAPDNTWTKVLSIALTTSSESTYCIDSSCYNMFNMNRLSGLNDTVAASITAILNSITGIDGKVV